MDINDTRGDWGGNAAGDALYRTTQTMNVFTNMGRNGWDGAGGDAQIVVRSTHADSTCGGIDSCGNFWPDPVSNGIPPGGAVLISHETQLYNFAASLDQVAHEWGHGVILKSSEEDFSGSNTRVQLSEGFADVIGQMVEKMTEPAGSGIEQSDDWDLGEDLKKNCLSNCYFFSGLNDDGPLGHSFGAWPATVIDNHLHKDDFDMNGPVPTDHGWGNMLNVTYRLLAGGGQNTVCSRLWLSGCGVTVFGLGVTNASQIMFDTIQWYLPSTAEWADLATYASAAAFDRYSQCQPTGGGHSAIPQQSAVDRAFGAIGYPRLTPPDLCP